MQQQSRKWVVIGGIVLLLFLIIFLVVLSLKPTSKKTTQQPFQNKDTSLVVPTAVSQWKTYIGTDYSLSYPSDWDVTVFPQSNGMYVIIKPQNLSKDDAYPSLAITTSPTSTNDCSPNPFYQTRYFCQPFFRTNTGNYSRPERRITNSNSESVAYLYPNNWSKWRAI